MRQIFRFLTVGVLCAAMFVLASPANATIISGSFTGKAVNVLGNPFTVQEGEAVTGFFSLDTSYPFVLQTGSATSAIFEYDGRPVSPDPLPPPPLRIVITAPGSGNVYDIAGDLDEIALGQEGAGQRLSLLTGYGGFCCSGSLSLFGAPDAFFSSLEVAALHGGDVDLSRSLASYSQKGALSFDVAFTSFSFDAAPVPEPSSLALILAGLAAFGCVRRRHIGSRPRTM